ncbi:hypothetical protein Bpfe_020061 [Biomphalaria pfeifferi]|uniref:Uncharacterized protein n=1 Tax=Biomphalaria pfeifferi TaxID=112525 RepID=A0AAD8B9M9_BIOPF|nr:hypothetical protein Bpfe_020061 [Biomphalaria pfeifferi]
MKTFVALVFTVAFACLVSKIDAQKCRYNSDCVTFCGGSINDAVCDVPSGTCHCHSHGEISCSNHSTCRRECGNPTACCNNDHHCHCHEACDYRPL